MSNSLVPSYDLTIDRGVPYVLRLVYLDSNHDPVNLSGYVGNIKIRDRNRHQAAACFSFPLIFNGATGEIEADIDTDQLKFSRGEYVVDITPPGGSEFRLLKGHIGFDEVWL